MFDVVGIKPRMGRPPKPLGVHAKGAGACAVRGRILPSVKAGWLARADGKVRGKGLMV